MRGAPARQAAAMFAIEVEILVQRDERETPRGAQPEGIILDAEQPGVIAAQRPGHPRAREEAGAHIIAVQQPIARASTRKRAPPALTHDPEGVALAAIRLESRGESRRQAGPQPRPGT